MDLSDRRLERGCDPGDRPLADERSLLVRPTRRCWPPCLAEKHAHSGVRRGTAGRIGEGFALKVVPMHKRGRGPARGEIDQAALELLAKHGAQILATARRYATTPEDAEDAYQRGLEILLTKAPTTSDEELLPWLKTVVKHEAFALRRQRERHSPVTNDGRLGDRATPPAITHDQAERLETLSQGAEALGKLKPHEIRALLLKAEGYTYREICELTGWSYTKVNRLLTEGRQAFLRRVAVIQGGGECESLAPALSALADGEASAEQLALLRPHMRSCLSCRAKLKAFREAPAKVAALVPPAALLGADPGAGPLRSVIESVLGSAQHKAAAWGERAHAAAELATGQKVAAVAASAAALAGGGTAVDHLANHQGPPQPPPERQEQQRVDVTPVKEETAVETSPAPVAGSEPAPTDPVAAPEPPPAANPEPAPAPVPAPAPAPAPAPPPSPATEFTPGPPAPAAAAPSPAPATPSAGGGFTPAAAGGASGGPSAAGAGGGDASREFAP
jgi:RNA polymerase sigma factor (sigma-70 family)